MIKWIFTLLSLVLFSRAISQNSAPVNGSLSGIVKDSVSGQPMENATIRLTTATRSNWKKEMITDSAGHFIIKNLLPDTYTLRVEFSGYSPFSQKNIVIAGGQDVVLKNILLSTRAKALQEVVVTQKLSPIDNRIDRVVYNVDKDVTSQGGVATDVLRKVPQVTVDVNGNVELLGNPSIRFLINGKPSTMFGNSIADALQSIPASQIQSIEVIASPGAKYDAAGTGGVINIILKKNKMQGFSGTVNATAGTRLENGSINLSFKKNNVGINAYASGTDQIKVATLTESERNTIDTATGNNYYLQQQGNTDFTRYGYRAGLGLDWDITPKDNLSVSLAHYRFGTISTGPTNQYNAEYDKLGNMIFNQYNIRFADSRFNNYSYEAGIDYRRKLKKEKEELSVYYNFSMNHNNTSYNQYQQYISNDSIFSGSSSNNPGKDYLSTIAIDYTYPVNKNVTIETGAKTEIESLISDANVYTFSPSQYKYVFDDQQTYQSAFRRQVYAGYLSGSFSLFKFLQVMAGARYEHTVNNANYSNAHNVVIPDYNNFVPSLALSHTFENEQSIRFTYTYRLERPEYRDLNPFVNLTDPHNINTGNPLIKPEIGRNYQLGYNWPFGKDNSLDVVLLYTHNSPDIKAYTSFYPEYKVGDSVYTNVNVTTRANIASEDRYGANISGSFNPFSTLTIRTNIQLYERRTKNIYAIPQNAGGFEYRLNANIGYRFPHGLMAEAFGNYNSGLHWQGLRAAFGSYTVAVRKQLFKGKGSLGLTAVNVMEKYLTQKSTQIGSGFTATTWQHIPYRSIGINFIYKFGKITISKPKEEDNYLTKPPGE
jgi:outer membrane receptor protein involved in Fe transport